jgi:hypothetical protein
VAHDALIVSAAIPPLRLEMKETAVPLERCLAAYYSDELITNSDNYVYARPCLFMSLYECLHLYLVNDVSM